MANVTEKTGSFPPVPLIQPGWKIKGGGEDAAANLQAVALTQRTANLKKQQDDLKALLIKGINVIGTLVSESALETIDTTKLTLGDAYFAEGALYVWNNEDWVSSGSLKAPPVDLATEISEDAGNVLRLGQDGKLYAEFAMPQSLLSIYNDAKE